MASTTTAETASAPFPWGRLALNSAAVLSLGSVMGFSAWGNRFQETFSFWTQADLSYVYATGMTGCHLTLLGGLLCDARGPAAGLLVGALGAWAGYGGVLLCSAWSATPSGAWLSLPGQGPVTVGAFYCLGETGVATIYMAVLCDNMLSLPAERMGLAAGVLALAYGSSAGMGAAYLEMLPRDLPATLGGLGALVTLFAAVKLFTLPRPWWMKVEPRKPSKEGPSTLAAALLSPDWFGFACYAILAQAPVVTFAGFQRTLGDVSGTEGRRLAYAAFMTTTCARVISGFFYDRVRDRLRPVDAMLLTTAASGLGFALLAAELAAADARPREAPVWVGVLWITFWYQISVPLHAQFVRTNFHGALFGSIIGVRALLTSFASLGLTVCFLQGDERGDGGGAPWTFYLPVLRYSALGSFVAAATLLGLARYTAGGGGGGGGTCAAPAVTVNGAGGASGGDHAAKKQKKQA